MKHRLNEFYLFKVLGLTVVIAPLPQVKSWCRTDSPLPHVSSPLPQVKSVVLQGLAATARQIRVSNGLAANAPSFTCGFAPPKSLI